MAKMNLKSEENNSINYLLKTHMPFLAGGDVASKRQEILQYFHDTFTLYESIFDCLKDEKIFYKQANTLRHPLIFYFGHTSVFFINKLNVARLINERVDTKLESMLSIGVDEMSWDDIDKQQHDWPSVAAVKAHRNKTRQIVDNFIRNCDFTLPISWDSPMWIILMGIEHERIHLETTSVLIRELPLELLQPHPLWSNICPESGKSPENSLLPVKGGEVHLGREVENPIIYGWDNEFGSFNTKIDDFKASKYLVSNGEFLEFVEANGYQQQKYWTQEGWRWVQFKKPKHPVYWLKEGSNYRYRTMLEVINMPWDWPVDINYLEAKAFCNWKSEKTGKSIRMPTEAEYYCLRKLVDDSASGNINLEHFMSACPVNKFAFADGFFDIIGNVWQWTETPIDGFSGFAVHPI